ncbi:MAG: ABC transporter permease [Bacteroidota bacterium]
MIKSYILIALRNLKRYKVYTSINILGLTVSLALAILLLSFIRYELSYENFNEKRDRIFRSVSNVRVSDNKTIQAPVTTGKVYNWVIDEIPEVESVLRLDGRSVEFSYEEKKYYDYTGFFSDTTFFRFFDFKLKYGDKGSALAPNSIIVTEKMANTIFGDENPLGETLSWGDRNLEVTGVMEELPKNTHLQFDFLIPFSVFPNLESYFENRGMSSYAYYLFKEAPENESNVAKLDDFIEEKVNEYFADLGMEADHTLQNLGDIHLDSEGLQYTITTPGNKNTIIILSFLAFFILFIAVINYINLETSRAETRTLEVGLRKVNGATRRNLIFQFIGESLITTFIAFVIAIGLAELFSGGFETLVNREFSHELYTPLNLTIYFGLALVLGVIAGFYPSIYLSSFKPAVILKSSAKMSRGNSRLRVFLVVAQFAIASFLVIALLVVYSQIKYAKTKDLGFNQEQVLVVKNLTDAMHDNYDVMKNELSDLPGVLDVSAATGYPGNITMHNFLRLDSQDGGVLIKDNIVKDDYDKILDLEILKGRYFSEEFTSDSNAYVLNERAVEMLGLENPVGSTIYHNESPGEVIGVMRNYHVESLKEEIMPVAHSQRRQYFGYLLVKTRLDNINETLERIETRLSNIDEGYIFEYEFIDDYFKAMYDEEERMNKTSLYSAAIAIIIALLGLYALTSFVVIKRRKEIGIRKAMGASVGIVVWHLIKDINKWVLLANVIAWPAAFYFIKQWLENFAYRIDISMWFFIAGTVITVFIALVVVTAQAYHAANENPAHTLRDE